MENQRDSNQFRKRPKVEDDYCAPHHHHIEDLSCCDFNVSSSLKTLDTLESEEEDDLMMQSRPLEVAEQQDKQQLGKIYSDENTNQVLRLSYSTCSITKRTKKKLPSFESVPKPNKREMKEKRDRRQMVAALTGSVGGFVLAGPFGAIVIGMGGAYMIKKMHLMKEKRALRKYMMGEIILRRLKAKDGVLT